MIKLVKESLRSEDLIFDRGSEDVHEIYEVHPWNMCFGGFGVFGGGGGGYRTTTQSINKLQKFGKEALHSATDAGKEALHSATDATKTNLSTATDAGKEALHSATDAARTNLHTATDAGRAFAHEASDQFKTGMVKLKLHKGDKKEDTVGSSESMGSSQSMGSGGTGGMKSGVQQSAKKNRLNQSKKKLKILKK